MYTGSLRGDDMNFLNLQYFLAVAEEGNFTRTAKRLNISQQALSNHVANLEKEFGVQLFSRAGELSLTFAGRQVVEMGSRIMDIRRQLDSRMADISGEERGELRIGVSYTRGQAILPQVLPRFKREHPRIDISLRESSSKELEDFLRHGEIDMMIGFLPIMLETVETLELARERLFLVVPEVFLKELYGGKVEEEQRKLQKNGAELTDFRKFPFIMLPHDDRVRTILDGELFRLGITPNILLETKNIQTAFALAGNGLGVTAYPELFLKSKFTIPEKEYDQRNCFPINHIEPETLVIGYDRAKYMSRATEAFISVLKDTFREGIQ